MSSRQFDADPAARRLAALWPSFEQIDNLPVSERPADMDEAYQLQVALLRRLNEPILGYKLGLSSASAMQRSGLDAPIVGFVPASRLHRSGDAVIMPPTGGFLIEAEIAFELGDTGTGIEPGRAALVFEIVRSRYRQRNEIDMPSYVGDASGFHGLVVGDFFPIAEIPELLAHGASISRDAETVSASLKRDELPDPLDAFCRFKILAAAHHFALGAGMTVATGNLADPYETTEPGRVTARLGPYQVEVELR
jgi:2-keto-4-pentenoate hydratase